MYVCIYTNEVILLGCHDGDNAEVVGVWVGLVRRFLRDLASHVVGTGRDIAVDVVDNGVVILPFPVAREAYRAALVVVDPAVDVAKVVVLAAEVVDSDAAVSSALSFNDSPSGSHLDLDADSRAHSRRHPVVLLSSPVPSLPTLVLGRLHRMLRVICVRAVKRGLGELHDVVGCSWVRHVGVEHLAQRLERGKERNAVWRLGKGKVATFLSERSEFALVERGLPLGWDLRPVNRPVDLEGEGDVYEGRRGLGSRNRLFDGRNHWKTVVVEHAQLGLEIRDE